MDKQEYDPNTPVVYPAQPYAAQPPPPGQQPTVVVVQTAGAPADNAPLVIPRGKGLIGKIPQFEFCCLFVPLRAGAIFIAFFQFVWNLWGGLVLLTTGSYDWYSGGLSAVLTVVGVIFLLISISSLFGLAGIYREKPKWIHQFTRIFLLTTILWALMQIASMAIQVSIWADYSCYGGYCIGGFAWAAWIVPFIIGLIFQLYFAACLISYERDFFARRGLDVNGKEIQMS